MCWLGGEEIKLEHKNKSIQLIRVIAMFMIVFDHIFCVIQFPMQSFIVQVTNSGVFIFLFISGYLYGMKKITNWKKWIKKRIIRICIPLWTFMVIDFILEALVWGQFEIKYALIYALNLQGFLGVNVGGTNLWFLTLIMMCYVITPALYRIKSQLKDTKYLYFVILILILLQLVLSYATNAGMVLNHTFSWCLIAILVYVLGYFKGNSIIMDEVGGGRLLISIVISIVTGVIVIVMRHFYDGSIIYDRIIIFYGLIIIDYTICLVVCYLGNRMKKLIPLIDFLDGIS